MKFHNKAEFGWRLKKLTGAVIILRLTAECAEKSKYALRTSAVYSIISTAAGVPQHVHHCPRPPPASQSNRELAVGLGREAGE